MHNLLKTTMSYMPLFRPDQQISHSHTLATVLDIYIVCRNFVQLYIFQTEIRSMVMHIKLANLGCGVEP